MHRQRDFLLFATLAAAAATPALGQDAAPAVGPHGARPFVCGRNILLLANSDNAISATFCDRLNFNFGCDIAPVGSVVGRPPQQ